MTGSLSDRLLGDKIWETNPYVNENRYRSTSRYVKILFVS